MTKKPQATLIGIRLQGETTYKTLEKLRDAVEKQLKKICEHINGGQSEIRATIYITNLLNYDKPDEKEAEENENDSPIEQKEVAEERKLNKTEVAGAPAELSSNFPPLNKEICRACSKECNNVIPDEQLFCCNCLDDITGQTHEKCEICGD